MPRTSRAKRSPRPVARQRDAVRTRATILDAAERLLLQHGVAETSLTQVARRARVTKSLIHHYFGSKDSLWTEVKQRRFASYVHEQIADLSPPPTDARAALQAAIERYFRFLSNNPDTVRLFARMWLEGDASLDDLDRQVTSAGAAAIREAQREGLVNPGIDALHMIAVFACASLGWFSFRHLSFAAGADASSADEAFLQDLLRVFFDGVLPAAPPSAPLAS